MEPALRDALEAILRPTTTTAEKIARCGALQDGLHREIHQLTEALHPVSVQCADRAGRVPAELDAHVAWVRQARGRASNVRRSLDGTKARLLGVVANLQRLAATEEDHAKRTEAQMKAIVAALAQQPSQTQGAPAPAPATSAPATTPAPEPAKHVDPAPTTVAPSAAPTSAPATTPAPAPAAAAVTPEAAAASAVSELEDADAAAPPAEGGDVDAVPSTEDA